MLRSFLATCALAVALFGAASFARAQVTEEPVAIFPDPSKFARGLFVEGDAGAVILVGKAGARVSPGPALALRVGYDVTRWLSVAALGAGSTHRGRFAGAPQDGELLQFYRAGGELKFTLTFRQLSLLAFGEGAYFRQSTNLLVATGHAKEQSGLAAGGGLGLDWHTLSRHTSVGLRAGYAALAPIAGTGLVASEIYLRYTF